VLRFPEDSTETLEFGGSISPTGLVLRDAGKDFGRHLDMDRNGIAQRVARSLTHVIAIKITQHAQSAA
jgi:hypothetical protein